MSCLWGSSVIFSASCLLGSSVKLSVSCFSDSSVILSVSCLLGTSVIFSALAPVALLVGAVLVANIYASKQCATEQN